jgi:hypothetical protein
MTPSFSLPFVFMAQDRLKTLQVTGIMGRYAGAMDVGKVDLPFKLHATKT